jgi:PHP family Zn ribbon phosphoesterase
MSRIKIMSKIKIKKPRGSPNYLHLIPNLNLNLTLTPTPR